MKDKKVIIECNCGDMDHIARLTYMAGDDYFPDSVNLHVHLNTYLPWYKRVLAAIKYIFKPGECRFGHYDSLILDPSQYQPIIELFEAAQKEYKENYKP